MFYIKNDQRGWLFLDVGMNPFEIIKNNKGDMEISLDSYMYSKKYTKTSKIQWECAQRLLIIHDTVHACTWYHQKI